MFRLDNHPKCHQVILPSNQVVFPLANLRDNLHDSLHDSRRGNQPGNLRDSRPDSPRDSRQDSQLFSPLDNLLGVQLRSLVEDRPHNRHCNQPVSPQWSLPYSRR